MDINFVYVVSVRDKTEKVFSLAFNKSPPYNDIILLKYHYPRLPLYNDDLRDKLFNEIYNLTVDFNKNI